MLTAPRWWRWLTGAVAAPAEVTSGFHQKTLNVATPWTAVSEGRDKLPTSSPRGKIRRNISFLADCNSRAPLHIKVSLKVYGAMMRQQERQKPPGIRSFTSTRTVNEGSFKASICRNEAGQKFFPNLHNQCNSSFNLISHQSKLSNRKLVTLPVLRSLPSCPLFTCQEASKPEILCCSLNDVVRFNLTD